MAPADVFLLLILLLIVVSAALGVIGVVRRWYRSCEEKYSPLIDAQQQSLEPRPHEASSKNAEAAPSDTQMRSVSTSAPGLPSKPASEARIGLTATPFTPRHSES